jgi:hypothetical protein
MGTPVEENASPDSWAASWGQPGSNAATSELLVQKEGLSHRQNGNEMPRRYLQNNADSAHKELEIPAHPSPRQEVNRKSENEQNSSDSDWRPTRTDTFEDLPERRRASTRNRESISPLYPQ